MVTFLTFDWMAQRYGGDVRLLRIWRRTLDLVCDGKCIPEYGEMVES